MSALSTSRLKSPTARVPVPDVAQGNSTTILMQGRDDRLGAANDDGDDSDNGDGVDVQVMMSPVGTETDGTSVEWTKTDIYMTCAASLRSPPRVPYHLPPTYHLAWEVTTHQVASPPTY